MADPCRSEPMAGVGAELETAGGRERRPWACDVSGLVSRDPASSGADGSHRLDLRNEGGDKRNHRFTGRSRHQAFLGLPFRNTGFRRVAHGRPERYFWSRAPVA